MNMRINVPVELDRLAVANDCIPRPVEGEPAAGASSPHESAALHVTGEAVYTDDIPELRGTVYAALGLSAKAHARVRGMDLEAVRRAPGVVDPIFQFMPLKNALAHGKSPLAFRAQDTRPG